MFSEYFPRYPWKVRLESGCAGKRHRKINAVPFQAHGAYEPGGLYAKESKTSE
jgi:hypothetical protein